ncbi:MAG: exosortase/archaeosortase family protein [Opitutales bacterium]
MSRSQLATAFILLAFAALMVWDQLFWWVKNEDYSFGFLVPFFVGYVLFHRWPVIRSFLFRGAEPDEAPNPESSSFVVTRTLEWLAAVGLLASLALFAIGMLIRMATGPQNPASLAIALSFSGILLSSVFIFTKETVDGRPMSLKARVSVTLLFIFPALIWMLSAPMVAVLDNKLRVFLMEKVTVVVFGVFDFMGYELERQGNILILPEGSVGVEEACSGIRSLTGCLFAGSFFGAVFLQQFWKKALMVFLAMCLAVLMNLIRSMFLTLWSYHYGPNAIDAEWSLPIIGNIGTVHDVTGILIMVLTSIGLLCFLPIFNYKLPEFDDEEEGSLPAHSNHT